MNERFAIQQGAFLCIGNLEQGFVGNLLSYDDIYLTSNLVKIVIPNELRTAALEDLNRMNINRATLFPGIDGFAQSLKHRLLFPMSSWDNFTDLLDRGMP
jgi:hypothetical protein